jgi:hypothetical protein
MAAPELLLPVLPFPSPLLEGAGAGILTLEAPRRLTGEVLGGLAPLVLPPDRRLYCVDGANCFDPYVFAVQTRRRGLDAGEVLDRVFLTRAFTIHQLEAVATLLVQPLAMMQPQPMVAFLGIDHLFLEETLPLGERRRCLADVLTVVRELRTAGMRVLVTHDPAAPGRDWWKRAVEGVGDARATVQQAELPARTSRRKGDRSRGHGRTERPPGQTARARAGALTSQEELPLFG